VLFVIAVIVGRAVWNLYIKERDTNNKLEEVRAEHNDLKERSEFLEYEIKRLSTDVGVEEEIRNQYGLAQEGERVFVIVDRDEGNATTTENGFFEDLTDVLLFWRE